MNYLEKLYRAVILDSELYEEVEADKSLTRQALMTVALVAIIEGIFSITSLVARPLLSFFLSNSDDIFFLKLCTSSRFNKLGTIIKPFSL